MNYRGVTFREVRVFYRSTEGLPEPPGGSHGPHGPREREGVGVKTGRSRVGGPKLCDLDQWVTSDERHGVFTQLRALSKI